MADTRNWQTRNRDKMREINRKWHAANRDKSNYAKRAARLGMTADELEAFLLKTKNRCMICGKRAKAAEKFHIDHDHKDRAVRGLLCLSCNVGIGFFLDNPVLLQKAIAYLQSAERFSATAGPKNTKPGRRRAAG